MGRTLSPKQTALLLEPKQVEIIGKGTDNINPDSYGSPKSKGSSYMDKFSKTDSDAMAKLVKQRA